MPDINPDVNAEEIEELLRKAWGEFCGDYNKKVREYSESVTSRAEAEAAHWILWNEHDLMVQLGRFFYEQLAKNSLSGIEMHIDVNLKDSNFPGYKFRPRLKDLRKELGKVPEVDLIIAQEDSPERFLLCAEAKCFHYSVKSNSRGKRAAADDIEKDIKRLLILRKLGVADSVVFLMLDDYYYLPEAERRDKEDKEGIKRVIDHYRKDLTILKHNSKAKLERWK